MDIERFYIFSYRFFLKIVHVEVVMELLSFGSSPEYTFIDLLKREKVGCALTRN